jgi:hypothetical protein
MGRAADSATLKACSVKSKASCAVSATAMIQPASLNVRMSLCSTCIFQGGPMVRVTTAITTGGLLRAVHQVVSYMCRSPWEEVAVKTLAPAMAAPYTTDMAENSDFTSTKHAFNSPFSTNSANFSTIGVYGVMG